MIFKLYGGPIDGGELEVPDMPVGVQWLYPLPSQNTFDPFDLIYKTHVSPNKAALYEVTGLGDLTFVRVI